MYVLFYRIAHADLVDHRQNASGGVGKNAKRTLLGVCIENTCVCIGNGGQPEKSLAVKPSAGADVTESRKTERRLYLLGTRNIAGGNQAGSRGEVLVVQTSAWSDLQLVNAG